MPGVGPYAVWIQNALQSLPWGRGMMRGSVSRLSHFSLEIEFLGMFLYSPIRLSGCWLIKHREKRTFYEEN